MDDALRRGGDIAEGVHVRHHVVPEALLVPGNDGEIDVVEVRAHLLNRRRGDVDAERPLVLREREPEPAPEPVPGLRAPQFEHRLGGVAFGERGLVLRVRHEMRKSVE